MTLTHTISVVFADLTEVVTAKCSQLAPFYLMRCLCLTPCITLPDPTSSVYAQPTGYALRLQANNNFVNAYVLSGNAPVSGIWSATVQAEATNSDYMLEWDSYANKWYNTASPKNTEFNLTYGNGSSANSVLVGDFINAKYYTLQIRGIDYSNRQAVVMETDGIPVAFHAVSTIAVSTPNLVCAGSATNININLTGPKSVQEKVFIRYSSNADFSNSKVVEAAGSGSNWSAASATIPGIDNTAGATIRYYAYTTTIAATNTADHDLITLRLGNNGGSNYFYTVPSASIVTFVGLNNGNWNNASNWCGGIVPTATSDVVIPNSINVTLDGAAVANSIVINGGLNFSGANTLSISSNGWITNNGTFTAGAGTVIFTGPAIVNGTAPANFNNLTLNGLTTFNSAPAITGTLQLNANAAVNTSPNYACSSLLLYNMGGQRIRGAEWTTATAGAGFPGNVQLSNSTVLRFNEGGAIGAACGNVTIDPGAALYSDWGGGSNSARLTVFGNLNIAGNLSLGLAAGGDLYVGGHLQKTGGTFSCNGRELRFIGSGLQNFSSNITENINFLRNAKTGGTLNLNTSITIPSAGNSVVVAANTTTILASGTILTLSEGCTMTANTSGSMFTINGTLKNTGVVGAAINATSANLIIGSSGIYEHNMTRAAQTNLGTIPLATWSTGSTCLINGYTATNTAGQWFSAGATQTFSNFIWNCVGQTNGVNMTGATLTINSTFTMSSTGISADGFRLGTGTNGTINCTNFSQSGGTIDMAAGAGSGTINISGNLNRTGGTLIETSTGLGTINFIGTANQSVTPGTNISNNISFRCNNPVGITIAGTLPINNGATFYRKQGMVTGIISYNATGSHLVYDGSALTTSNGEWPTSNGPVNVTINTSINTDEIVLHENRMIAGILTLSNGKIRTISTRSLTVTNIAAAAVAGGSNNSFVNGPLDRAVSSGVNYTFPVGNSSYLPVAVSSISTTSGVLRLEAFDGNSNGIFDGSLSAISADEYWSGTLRSGTLSAATFNFTRPTPVGSFTTIARSTSGAAGLYGSIGGTAGGNSISNAATGGVLGHFVMGSAEPVYYWSNSATMNWGDAANWLVTTTASFVNPFTTSTPPNALNSLGITIRNGHTVSTVGTNISLDQTLVQNGGVLNYNGGSMIVENGSGEDLVIETGGRFTHTANLNAPTLSAGVIWRVKTSASIEVNTNAPGAQGDYYASNENAQYAASMVWENAAVFVWNSTGILSTASLTYFVNADASTIPIFRLSANVSLPLGSNGTTTINGLLEANGNVSWQNVGSKIFRNGIIGTGTVTQNINSGQFVINGNTSKLGGAGIINLGTNGLRIAGGTCSLLNNKNINATAGAGTITLANGTTLVAYTNTLSGNALYTQENNATLETAHANGVNGTIQLSGTKVFQDFANYTFNGTSSQTSGLLMGNTIGTLTIANPATVTLSKTGHTTSILNMNAGSFLCGTNQNLNIASGGTINSIGGNQPNDASAGSITFLGSGFTNGNITGGNPNLYSVVINGGVDFNGNPNTNSARILNRLQINNGGFCNQNAPYYEAGSSLVYNIGGNFNRNIEWGQLIPGEQGYPWHVIIQNNGTSGTQLNLGINIPSRLAIGGDLIIGSGSNNNNNDVDMNSIAIPLEIGGNLYIGDLNSTNNHLRLSSGNEGNLELYGNFTRYKPNNYYDNEAYNGNRGRATIFKGAANSLIEVISTNPAEELQKFHKMVMDKTNAADVSVLVPNLFIENELNFTNNGGIIHTTISAAPSLPAAPPSSFGLITIETTATVTGTIGNNNFVNGQIAKIFPDASGTVFSFPVGKAGTPNNVRPFTFRSSNNIAGTMRGEYMNADPPLSGSDFFASSLLGIINNEYWQLDKTAATALEGQIILPYVNPGNGNWRTWNGSALNPCANCNVAVVKRNATSGNGIWDFTAANGLFSSTTYPPEYRAHTNNGEIASGVVSSFSPFTIGFAYNVILGAPLPVKLLRFHGRLSNGNAALNWNIESAADLQMFEVQHSTNGIRFDAVGYVPPLGLQYAFTHAQIPAGTHYYRLLVKQKSGNSYFSNIVKMEVVGTATFVSGLQNTSAQKELSVIIWSATSQQVVGTLYDQGGKLIATNSGHLIPGKNQFRIAVPHLANGIYYLNIQIADGVRKTLHWLKQ